MARMARCTARAWCALYAGHQGACQAAYGGVKAAYFVCLDLSTSVAYGQERLLTWLHALWEQIPLRDREAMEEQA